jgi:hypothetical protein
VPPIEQLQRVPQLMLQRLERQGVFTTGLLLEVSETRTRRQTLADQIYATTNDVNDWRDEALLLNLASFGVDEQRLFTQAGIVGLRQLLACDRETFGSRLDRAARTLGMDAPSEITVDGWYLQAHTLEDE